MNLIWSKEAAPDDTLGGVDPTEGDLPVPGHDISAFWLLGDNAGGGDFLPKSRPILILLTLFDRDARKKFTALKKKIGDGGEEQVLMPFAPIQIGRPFPVLINKPVLEAIRVPPEAGDDFDKFRKANKAIKLSAPLTPGTFREKDTFKDVHPPDKMRGSIARGAVIRAVIDDGVGLAHERFQTTSEKSRILFHWNMRGEPPKLNTSAALPAKECKAERSATVPYGVEHTKADIDRQFRDNFTLGRIDEDRVYRALGLIDPERRQPSTLALQRAHGTHILDTFAGANRSDVGDSPLEAPLIVVQLPPAVVADTSGASLDAHIGAALEYIRSRAKLVTDVDGAQPPVVVNISYGTTAGPHDGTTQIEQLMDSLIAESDPEMRIVVAAGNSHLTPCHARVPAPRGRPDATLTWRLFPDDRTPSHVEMWLPWVEGYQFSPPPEADWRARIRVREPSGGTWSEWLGEEPGQKLALRNEHREVFALRYAIDAMARRGVFVAWMRRTWRPYEESVDPFVAPAGDWLIEIDVESAANNPLTRDDPLRAWIQRDDNIPGYPQRGRQSFFFDPETKSPGPNDDADAPEFAPPDHSPVRRASLLNVIATGSRTIVAGGYERRRYMTLPFSAGGPCELPWRRASTPGDARPDALAPASDSLVARGVLAAGSRSGSVVAMGGTSVAAPWVARIVAEGLAAGETADRDWVRLMSAKSERDLRRTYLDVPSLPLDRGGYGRLSTDGDKRRGIRIGLEER